jgi:hypothetical protein
MHVALSESDNNLLNLLLQPPANPTRPATLIMILAEGLKMNDGNRRLTVSVVIMNTGTPLAARDLGALLHETFNFSSDTRLLELF